MMVYLDGLPDAFDLPKLSLMEWTQAIQKGERSFQAVFLLIF